MPMLPSAPAAAPTHEPPVNAAAPLSFADRRRQSDQPKAGAQLYRQTGAQRRSGRQWRRSAEPAANGALRRHSNGFADAGNGRRRSGTGDSSGRAAATGGRTDAADHRHDRTRHERRQRKCLQLGFDGYIAKPILLEKLAEKLRRSSRLRCSPSIIRLRSRSWTTIRRCSTSWRRCLSTNCLVC